MKKDTVNRRIMSLAFPAIASNITVPLLGLSDTAITGHLGETAYIAAIAAGGTMVNVIYWLCGFLRMGTTGLTAEAYGEKSEDKIGMVFSRSVILAVIIGLAALLLRHPLSDVLIEVISPAEDVARLASEYFCLTIWGSPAMLVTLSISGWFVGMQNTVYPMIISVSVNVVNIVTSLLLVFVAGMGFVGVAMGTMISNWFGLLLSVILLSRFSRGHRLLVSPVKAFGGGGMLKFFNVSSTLFVRSLCIIAVSFGVTAIGARLGSLTLAANAVMMQFFIFFSYFMDGFAFSGEALCGRSAGEEDRQTFDRVVKALFRWGAALALVFTAAYAVAGRPVVGLLTDVESVREAVGGYLIFVWLIPAVSVWAFILDGIFVGLTATSRMMLTTVIATAVFFAVAVIMPHYFEASANALLWTAFLSYLFIRGLGLWFQLPSTIRRRFKTQQTH